MSVERQANKVLEEDRTESSWGKEGQTDGKEREPGRGLEQHGIQRNQEKTEDHGLSKQMESWKERKVNYEVAQKNAEI